MEKLKHTPGPWKFVHTDTSPLEKREWHSVVQMPVIALSILNVKHTISKEETEANAKLIAAAPDMLKFIMEMAERYENSQWIASEANALIKKAVE